MPKYVAEDFHAEDLEEKLAELGYPHLCVRLSLIHISEPTRPY